MKIVVCRIRWSIARDLHPQLALSGLLYPLALCLLAALHVLLMVQRASWEMEQG